MKASIGAGILLLILLVTVCANAIFVKNTTQALTDQIQSLSDLPSKENPQKIKAIQTYFEEKEPLLRISVSFLLLDRVKEHLEALRLYAESDMTGDYLVTKALLLDAVEDMGRMERLKIFNSET